MTELRLEPAAPLSPKPLFHALALKPHCLLASSKDALSLKES